MGRGPFAPGRHPGQPMFKPQRRGVSLVTPPVPAAAAVGTLAAWYDASTFTAADGTAIATWTDGSGKGNHLVQATGAKQPIVKQNILGPGKHVARFAAASNQQMTCPWAASLTTSSQITVYGVCRSTLSVFSRLIGSPYNDGVAAPNYNWSILWLSTNDIELRIDTDAPSTPVDGAKKAAYSAWSYRTSDRTLRWDGSAFYTGVGRSVGYVGTQYGLIVGGDVAIAGQAFDGDIAELLVFMGNHSDAQRNQMELYLCEKWGIPHA